MIEIEQFICAKVKPEFEPIFSKFRTLIRQKFPTLQEEVWAPDELELARDESVQFGTTRGTTEIRPIVELPGMP